MKFLMGLVLSFGLSTAVWAEDDLTMEGILALAKMSGACGIVKLQLDFQTSTAISGGDDFMYDVFVVSHAIPPYRTSLSGEDQYIVNQ